MDQPKNINATRTTGVAHWLLLTLAVAAVLAMCLFPELPGLFRGINEDGRESGLFMLPYIASFRDRSLPPVTQLAVAWGTRPLLRMVVLAVSLATILACHCVPSLRRHPWLTCAVDFAMAVLAASLTVAAFWALMLGNVRGGDIFK